MTDAGQTTFAEGFVRPSVPDVQMPSEITARFPAAPQLRPLDLYKAAERKTEINDGWTKEVLGQ